MGGKEPGEKERAAAGRGLPIIEKFLYNYCANE